MEYELSEAKIKIPSLIKNKHDFVISAVTGELHETAQLLEKEIEKQGMKCRVYTRNRGYAVAAAAFVPYAGWAAVAGVISHRLATRNPDFEVGKDLGGNKIHVTYKKKR